MFGEKMDFDDFSSDYNYDYSGLDSSYSSSDVGAAAAAFGALGIGMSIVIGLIGLVLIIFQFYVFARIIGKMGFSPWLVLLNLIPAAGLILIIYFAFVEWPLEKQVKKLKGGNKEE